MTALTTPIRSMSEVQLFFGLVASSRPLQATLSIAQPLFAALLAFGGILPLDSFTLLALGSLTGMFAVFALNDYLDYSLDKKGTPTKNKGDWDIDSVMTLHPYAQGMISKPQQLAWIGINGIITILILHSFSNVALALFLVAIILEASYCQLATRTPWKAILAGLIVSVGGFIGWFAAQGNFNFPLLFWIGFVYFCWEIGGRNIPNDMADYAPDRQKGIRTTATQHGLEKSARVAALFSILTIGGNGILAGVANLGFVYVILTTLAGIYWMIIPAIALMRNPTSTEALNYFNRASLFPIAMMGGLLIAYGIGSM